MASRATVLATIKSKSMKAKKIAPRERDGHGIEGRDVGLFEGHRFRPSKTPRQHRKTVFRHGHAALRLTTLVNVISWLKIEPREFDRKFQFVVGVQYQIVRPVTLPSDTLTVPVAKLTLGTDEILKLGNELGFRPIPVPSLAKHFSDTASYTIPYEDRDW